MAPQTPIPISLLAPMIFPFVSCGPHEVTVFSFQEPALRPHALGLAFAPERRGRDVAGESDRRQPAAPQSRGLYGGAAAVGRVCQSLGPKFSKMMRQTRCVRCSIYIYICFCFFWKPPKWSVSRWFLNKAHKNEYSKKDTPYFGRMSLKQPT